jgi:hypothetical protein
MATASFRPHMGKRWIGLLKGARSGATALKDAYILKPTQPAIPSCQPCVSCDIFLCTKRIFQVRRSYFFFDYFVMSHCNELRLTASYQITGSPMQSSLNPEHLPHIATGWILTALPYVDTEWCFVGHDIP